MKDYRVKWEIDLFADSPEQAAKLALEIQRDPKSSALVFDVSPCETPDLVFEIDLEVPSE